jgi:hypothetical protein
MAQGRSRQVFTRDKEQMLTFVVMNTALRMFLHPEKGGIQTDPCGENEQ